jgi:FlaA1/EpsC-like NDP-sugar epimerase
VNHRSDRMWPLPRPSSSRGVERFGWLRDRRELVVRVLDGGAWGLGVVLATLGRYDFDVPRRAGVGMLVLGALAVVVALLIGTATGVHRGRYVVGSIEETVAVARLHLMTGIAVIVVDLLVRPRLIPLSAAAGAFLFAVFATTVPRWGWRVAVDHRGVPDLEHCRRVLVFGAGEAGTEIVRALLREPDSQFLPVAILDDDPRKMNLSVMGVRVVGNRAALPGISRSLRADTLLVAIPSAKPELKLELASAAFDCGLDLRILPPVSELIETALGVHAIREVTEADLLGRPQVDIDVDAIASYLHGARVLVTGAGGSIGSEICRQVTQFGPSRLVLLDRDESALHAVQLSLDGRAQLADPNLVVADIRDWARVAEVFERHQPEVVFHAAALKHVPLLEMHPAEGVKTNVWGTRNVLDAAHTIGCSRFVTISTDKAADPVSVLGYTKRIAERLTAAVAMDAEGVFLSVRFGNVLGSRGSVLPTFLAQIEAGGPVTVTHPDVTRYFMTTKEAVRLVIQAAAIGEPGEVLVLDMGSPVRIDDVARRLISRSGRRIEIVYTGLRAGERLHERLLGAAEVGVSRSHPLIFHTGVEPLPTACLGGLSVAELARFALSPSSELAGRSEVAASSESAA